MNPSTNVAGGVALLATMALSLNAAPVDQLAPNASGLALVEVMDVIPFDERPSDGDAGVRFKLRMIKGSGTFHDTLYVVTALGGERGPGPHPDPPDFLRADTFAKGNRYWIAFASQHDYQRHPQGVVNYWPVGKDPAAEKALAAAVAENRFRWSPQFDPATKISYGRMADPDADPPRWRIRVEQEGMLLWEKDVPGTMSQRYFSWILDPYASTNFPDSPTSCGKVLVAETGTHLKADNEFGLPAGPVYIQTAYDPETGHRLVARVSKLQDGDVLLLRREYDPRTGRVTKETK